MRYDGKRGLWWIFTLVFYNLAIVWSVVEREKYNGFVVCLIALLIGDVFLLVLNAKTYVEVKNNVLIVVLGFSRKSINCDSITSLEKTHSPIASMALSFDRVKVSCGTECVYVSVKDNDKLIRDLKDLNPGIKVK
ncbi:hypothetical protein DW775_08045 [Agathobacter rectalis]|jgi:hypothetical protein|uniref:Uncharacterized protein YyaB-like PH domain-containing protein n=1 Tax=Agathobacter rectalis TaxID=39491 RepID=A0A414HYN3_9FIRM|nr:PH domain-containing protein [Agathobacter rectalis]RGW41403.1 hypothetical protein DWV78_00830 [Agathobacter rectalis]RGZ93707.1 hypothetical protein DW967_06205 [Agathobacter rectalis]RHD94698.1 hypothetical protein DW775_08045 [Agathobacter rectalis]